MDYPRTVGPSPRVPFAVVPHAAVLWPVVAADEVSVMGELIVGVDGSDGAGTALMWAVEEARRTGDDLTVVTVQQMIEMLTVEAAARDAYRDRLDTVAADRAESILKEAVAACADAGVATSAEVLRGTAPAWPLVRRAAHATMLVVGSRGLGNVRRLLLGSVSHQVAVHARTTVVVVPEPTDTDRRSDKVVVGVDGSPHARAALRRAAKEAALRQWELEAILVAPSPPAMVSSYPSQSAVETAVWTGVLLPDGRSQREERQQAYDESVAHWRHAAQAHLADELALIDHDDRPEKVTATVISARHPVGALLDAAAWARLLVVGRRGRGGFRGMLLGSVSQHCVRHATAPVMVVPPDSAADDKS
jgi:nucleotide-binding universal stress UspA family protein